MKNMKHLSILLVVCLLGFGSLSLKAAEALAAASQAEENHRAYLMSRGRGFLVGSDHSLYGMIDRLQEAYVARDRGYEKVSSELPVEHALRLRKNILETLWGRLPFQTKREIRGHVDAVFQGEFTLHKEILAILALEPREVPVESFSTPEEENSHLRQRPSLIAGRVDVESKAGDDSSSTEVIRDRSRVGGRDLLRAPEARYLAQESNYPFPGRTVTLDTLQTLFNSWYDLASLPNHFEKSTLARTWATVKEYWDRKKDEGRFLRRQLYILAGKLDTVNFWDRLAGLANSNIRALSADEKTGRNQLLTFILNRLHNRSIQVYNPPALGQLINDFALEYPQHSAIVTLLRGANNDGHTLSHSVTRNWKGIKLHHMKLEGAIAETVNNHIPTLPNALAFGSREQTAITNILSYSNDLDKEEVRRTQCQSCFSKVFCCSWGDPKPLKKARRNLRFLVQQANKGNKKATERLRNLLLTYEKSGVKVALQSLQWGLCRDSHRFGFDVKWGDLSISAETRESLIRSFYGNL